jgi:hypothetical protein
MSLVLDWLFIGDRSNGYKPHDEISRVLNVVGGGYPQPDFLDGLHRKSSLTRRDPNETYLMEPLSDFGDTNLRGKKVRKCLKFMKDCDDSGDSLLVHW